MEYDKQPLVSIALCTYNSSEFIVEQLDSIIAQDYKNLEVIICDDLSTDNTLDILEEFSEKNKVVLNVYKNETGSNLGFIKNFEKAILKCNGDLIALSDHDDVWLNHKISTLVNNIKNNILIYSDSELINEKGELLNIKVSDKINFIRGSDIRNLLFNNCISGHTIMFKKKLIQYALPFPKIEYHDWWLAFIALAIGKIDYVNIPLVRYRMHANNVSDTNKHLTNKKNTTNKKNKNQHLNLLETYTSFKQYRPSDQELIKTLKKLVIDRENKIISFKLFLFWVKHGKHILATTNFSRFKKIRFISRKIVGKKLKAYFE